MSISEISELHLLSEMQYNTMVECFKLLKKDFATLMAVIYMYNVEYPKNLEGKLIFIQKFVPKISDKQKIPGKVLKPILPLKNVTVC